MSDGKVKMAKAKPKFAMIPLSALTGLARVFAYGGKKYAPGNFLQAKFEDGAPERYLSAVFRHWSRMQEATGLFTRKSLAALDDESGLPHIDHAICGLIMLRQILVKDLILPEDPGEGKEPK